MSELGGGRVEIAGSEWVANKKIGKNSRGKSRVGKNDITGLAEGRYFSTGAATGSRGQHLHLVGSSARLREKRAWNEKHKEQNLVRNFVLSF